MSFQAYINTITALTKRSPEEIRNQGLKTGHLKPDLTAKEFCAWLAKDFKLGQGHAMALWKYFIESQWIQPKKTTIK